MAKIRVAPVLVEDLLFGFSKHPVTVTGAGVDPDGCLFFDVVGADVPDVPEASVLCQVQANRAGQRLVTMTFTEINRSGKQNDGQTDSNAGG